MRKLIYVLPLFCLAACATVSTPDTPTCQNLANCVSDKGVAVIGEHESGNEILSIALEGTRVFEQYFDVEPSSIAIVQGGNISSELNQQIKAAGFTKSLPWLSESDKATLRTSTIKSQVLEQTKGMPKEQQAAILQQALAQAGGNAHSAGAKMDAKQAGALTHELGHLWFIAAFQPDQESDSTSGHGYGGWAPDWLDETAAILMENDALTTSRRQALTSMPADQLYPLSDFLTMDHPLSAAAKDVMSSRGLGGLKKDESRSIVLTGAEAEAFLKKSTANDPGKFYTQARGFIDFMQAHTNDPQVFSDIAKHLAGGGSFESFLTTRQDLPPSIEALNQAWSAWLEQRQARFQSFD